HTILAIIDSPDGIEVAVVSPTMLGPAAFIRHPPATFDPPYLTHPVGDPPGQGSATKSVAIVCAPSWYCPVSVAVTGRSGLLTSWMPRRSAGYFQSVFATKMSPLS